MRLASRFGRVNQIRRDRPLTREELMQHVPSVFGEDKHDSEAKSTPTYPRLPCWRTLNAKGSSHSLPVSHECATRADGNIQSICCDCVVPVR
jgi:hypothetical protein